MLHYNDGASENPFRKNPVQVTKLNHCAALCGLLIVSKGVAVWALASASSLQGGDFGEAALIATAGLLPSICLEIASVVYGFSIARRFKFGPAMGADVERSTWVLSHLIYGCYFASMLGVFGIGSVLGLGLAIAAPLLAPFTPMLIGSGVLFVLTSALSRGRELEAEVAGLV